MNSVRCRSRPFLSARCLPNPIRCALGQSYVRMNRAHLSQTPEWPQGFAIRARPAFSLVATRSRSLTPRCSLLVTFLPRPVVLRKACGNWAREKWSTKSLMKSPCPWICVRKSRFSWARRGAIITRARAICGYRLLHSSAKLACLKARERSSALQYRQQRRSENSLRKWLKLGDQVHECVHSR